MVTENARNISTNATNIATNATNIAQVNEHLESIKQVKYIDFSLTNLSLSTKSSSGAYYGTILDLSSTEIKDKTVIAVTCENWSTVNAHFSLYLNNSKICGISDSSVSIGVLKIRVAYLD